jgi:alpha-beta hydrolase superfamily lysophospholipase
MTLAPLWKGIDALLRRTDAPNPLAVRVASSLVAIALGPLVAARMLAFWNDASENPGEQFSRRWPHRGGDRPRGRVFILHGVGEHSGRYEHVAAQWTHRGFEVHALDHRGHGRSCARAVAAGAEERPECYFGSYKDLVRDAVAWIDAVASANSGDGVPNFLFGHSMGGGLAVHVARAMPGTFRGVCLSAPAIKPDPKVATPTLIAITRVLARALPRLPVKKLPSWAISRDASVVEAYLADRLVYTGGLRSAVALTLLEMTADVMAGAKRDAFPYLLLHGTADRLCAIEGSVEYHELSTAKDKSFGQLDGLYHEICNEPEGSSVIGKFGAWMEARC